MDNKIDLKVVHKYCSGHGKQIADSQFVGCFYCQRIYAATDVVDWCDDPPSMGLGDGSTAICPHCSIDSVLPDSIVAITPELLSAMNKRWF